MQHAREDEKFVQTFYLEARRKIPLRRHGSTWEDNTKMIINIGLN